MDKQSKAEARARSDGRVKVMRQLTIREHLSRFLDRWVGCALLDKHTTHCMDGSLANFCGYCGKQLNPRAYRRFTLAAIDGSEYSIVAVNEVHAKSQLRGKYHPANLRVTGEKDV